MGDSMNDSMELLAEVLDLTDDQRRSVLFFLIGYCSRQEIVAGINHAKRMEEEYYR